MAIKNTTLTTSTQTVFTCPSGEYVVTPIYVTNVSGAAIQVNVFVVNNSAGTGVADISTCVYRNHTVNSDDTYIIDLEKIILANAGTGDFIAANVGGHANANANVTMTISYASV
jgi:hypothetical protein